jgi:sugar/nucleoside kinase (ribokinase family)
VNSNRPVVVIGPIYSDTVFAGLARLPLAGEEVQAVDVGWAPGGYAISALAFHRLEVPTTLCGEVGADLYGDALLTAFRAQGLATRRVRQDPGTHTNLAVTLNWDGDRGIVSYGRGAVAPAEWYEEALAEAGAGAVLYLSARHPHARKLATLARSLSQEVALSLSWHPEFLTSWALRDLLPLADMLFCNVPEALLVTSESRPERAGAVLAESVPEVVVTRGAEGATAWDHGRAVAAPARSVVLVDATGAGDVFSATYVAARLWGWPVERRLAAANWAAGHAIGAIGGGNSSPTRDVLMRGLEGASHAEVG